MAKGVEVSRSRTPLNTSPSPGWHEYTDEVDREWGSRPRFFSSFPTAKITALYKPME
ncbi:MAG: hypothetical protein KA314_10180 [Chloroflexi bacterium]|nr:hypothetical protein [Chloroflexota bacterium]MBP8056200.1 hypothetical protein [Chloroflexota bacterium]